MGWEINTRGASAAPALPRGVGAPHPGSLPIQGSRRHPGSFGSTVTAPSPPRTLPLLPWGRGGGHPLPPQGPQSLAGLSRGDRTRRSGPAQGEKRFYSRFLLQDARPAPTSVSSELGDTPGSRTHPEIPVWHWGEAAGLGGTAGPPPRGWEEVGAGSAPTPARAPSPRPKGTSGGAEGPSPGAGGAGTPSATGAGAPGEPRSPGSRPACAARGPARSSRPCGCPRCRRTPAPVPWGTNTP